jgi:hypothetical protein
VSIEDMTEGVTCSTLSKTQEEFLAINGHWRKLLNKLYDDFFTVQWDILVRN